MGGLITWSFSYIRKGLKWHCNNRTSPSIQKDSSSYKYIQILSWIYFILSKHIDTVITKTRDSMLQRRKIILIDWNCISGRLWYGFVECKFLNSFSIQHMFIWFYKDLPPTLSLKKSVPVLQRDTNLNGDWLDCRLVF